MSITTPRFNLFDKEAFRDVSGDNRVLECFKNISISSSVSGRGQLIIGTVDGFVYTVDRDCNLSQFVAHRGALTHMHLNKQSSYLFTIGTDFDSKVEQCNVWCLDRISIHGVPHCSKIIKVSHGHDASNGQDTQVSCWDVAESLQMMVIGYTNGSVTLYTGDLTKERSCKTSTVHSDGSRVTGVSFRPDKSVDKHGSKVYTVFICYVNQVVAYKIMANEKPIQILCEGYGCELHCSALSDETSSHQFIIGRSDGVHYMQPEGRVGTTPLEGEKFRIHCHRSYLLTVSKGNINKDMDIVTIYDMQNKFIAYSGPMPRVNSVLFEWGSIYVIGGSDNRAYILQEKSTQAKLEILFKKNQYTTAISIAKRQRYDTHGLVDIYRQFGDYLYDERSDPDGAIEQYIKTIGHLEPSYVIQKFLDAQRLRNLTDYLEALHDNQEATEDHTTLLLNCYTKLKESDKLDQFIKGKDKNDTVNFEVETAIKVLRQADYHHHALQLAERHNKHDWYMKIQLENVQDYNAALKYMKRLPFDEAERNMKKYGKILVSVLPRETTDFLKKLCLGETDAGCRAAPDAFIHIFVNKPTELRDFLDVMVSSSGSGNRPTTVVYNTLLELHVQEWSSKSTPQETERWKTKTLDLLRENHDQYAKDHALLLCQMYKFTPGILYLYEQGKLYQQILRHHMEEDDYQQVIAVCKQWGNVDPELWVTALSYFAKKEDAGETKMQDVPRCQTEMQDVLQKIDEQSLLPTLLVIQTLANSRVCTLGLVKEFLINRVETENKQIEEDEALMRRYSEERSSLSAKINSLRNEPTVFQASRCSVCRYPLELPSIHFLCGHSFHTHCFESYAESESDCPACIDSNRRVLELIKEQAAKTNETAREIQSGFQSKLANAATGAGGFHVIAEYFSRGILTKRPHLAASSLGTSTLPSQLQTPIRSGSIIESSRTTAESAVKTAASKSVTPVRMERKNPFTSTAGSDTLSSIYGSTSRAGGDAMSKNPPGSTHHSSVSVKVTSHRSSQPSTALPSTQLSKSPKKLEIGSPATISSGATSTKNTTQRPAAASKRVTELLTPHSKGHTRASSDTTSYKSNQPTTKISTQPTTKSPTPPTTKSPSQPNNGQRSTSSRLSVQPSAVSTSKAPVAKQSVKSYKPTQSQSSQKSTPSLNPFDDGKAASKSANPFDEPTNPFDEPTNPFDEPENPFSEPSNPFDAEPSNPFETEPNNPIGGESTNPFDEPTNPFGDS